MAQITPEAEQLKPVAETMTFVDTKKMAEEAIANNAELTVAKKADQVESNKKYDELAGEIKELKSPEEKAEIINKRIQELQKELAEKEEDYKKLTTTSSYSNGVGGLNFVGGTAAESLRKYPGVDKIADLLAVAADKNKEKKSEEKAGGILGKLGLHKKTQEINNYDYQLIKNALTTGNVGNLSHESKLEAYKTVVSFLEQNEPELLKTAKYQEVIQVLGELDPEFAEDKKSLLVAENNKTDRPTSIKDAMGFDKTINEINSLETDSGQPEAGMKVAA